MTFTAPAVGIGVLAMIAVCFLPETGRRIAADRYGCRSDEVCPGDVDPRPAVVGPTRGRYAANAVGVPYVYAFIWLLCRSV